MKYLCLLWLLCYSFNAFSQVTPLHWQWAKADTNTKYSISPTYPKSVLAASKNRLLWGVIKASAASGNYKLAEYDTTGTKLDSAVIGGKISLLDAQADAAGNWYILGTYSNSIIFANGFISTRTVFNAPDHFIARLDAGTLDMNWFKPIGTSYVNTAVSFCISGNTLYLPVDSANNTVYKVDINTGSFQKIITETNGGRVSSIAVDGNGNVYLAGSCVHLGTVDFNGHTYTNNNMYQTYVVRYHADGQFDWVLWANDVTCPSRKLSYANDNTIYYSGGLYDSLTLGTVSIKKPRILGSNFIVASLDSTGYVRWAHQSNDSFGIANLDYAYNAVVADTTFVILPQVQGKIGWGNGIDVIYGPYSAAGVTGYSASGNTLWTKQTKALYATPQHIATNGSDIWISGNLRDSFTLTLDTVICPTAHLAYNPFVAKLKLPSLHTDTTTTGMAVAQQNTFTVIPNPATQNITIKGFDKTIGMVHIRLVNTTGICVYEHEFNKPGVNKTIDVASYPRGIYFVEINSVTARSVYKIVLE